MSSFILGEPGLYIVTNADGTVAAVAGLPITTTTVPQAALAAGLVTDADGFHIPAITALAAPVTLLPALISDADSFLAPAIVNTSQFLLPALVTADDNILAIVVDRVSHGKQTLKPLTLVSDTDTIYAPLGVDVVLLSLRPATVASDDAVPALVTTRYVAPGLVVSGDGIIVADVGWHLFVDAPVTDVDEGYGAHAEAWAYIVPDVLGDEDSVTTYPFRLQQLQGGIPVPPRAGVLKGSIKPSPQLIGSIAARRLSGSHASGATRLSGSLRAGARRSARR